MFLAAKLTNGHAACAGFDLKRRFVGIVLVQNLRRIQQIRGHLKQKGMISQQRCRHIRSNVVFTILNGCENIDSNIFSQN